MSIERCISALQVTYDELRWISTRDDVQVALPPSAGHVRMGDFMRDLALDVDLRGGAAGVHP